MGTVQIDNVQLMRGKFVLNIGRFALAPHQIVLVIGPNGTGKTTLCKLLSGILTKEDCVPGRGAISLPDPHPVLLWQDLELFPLSVENNLRVVNRNKAVVENLLSQFRLTGKRKKRVDGLSGGYRERAAIARAFAVPNAQYFAFDEPTKAADKERVVDVAHCIIESARNGRALAIATHDERLVSELSRDVMEIYIIEDRLNGELQVCDLRGPFSPQQFFTSPPTVFAAKFAGYENIFALIEPSRPVSVRNIELVSEKRRSGKDKAVVIPWAALKVTVEPHEGAVEVSLGPAEFRSNGTLVNVCRWRPHGGAADLEFVVPNTNGFQGRAHAFLSVESAGCLGIGL